MDPEELPEGFEFVDEEPDGFHAARSSRVMQVPETRITASPDGGGTIRGGLGTEAEPAGDVTPETDAPLVGLVEKDAPAAPPSEREYRDAVRAREDAVDGTTPDSSFLGDALTSLTAMDGQERRGADRRTARRAHRAIEEVPEDPVSAMLGAGDGATLGWLDEMGGIAMSHPSGVSRTTGQPYGEVPYERVRDDIRHSMESAQSRSPYAYGTGEIVGTAAGGSMLGAEEAGLSGGGRVLQGIRQGAEIGGLSAAGNSGEGDDLGDDVLAGMLGGGVAGGAVGLGGAALRRLGTGARRIGEGADRARRASIGGSAADLEALGELTGGEAGIARRIRDLDLVGPVSGVDDIVERSTRARDVARSDTRSMRDAIETHGPVPTRQLSHTLRQQADALARTTTDPALLRQARMIRARARLMDQQLGESVPYRTAEGQLDALDSVIFGPRGTRADTAAAEALGPARRALRGELDTVADARLGEGAGERFRQRRLDDQLASIAAERGTRALDQSATQTAPTLTGTLLGSAAGIATGSPLAAAAATATTGAARGSIRSLRATGAELMQRIIQNGNLRALGAYGPTLQRALERGTFPAIHETLMRRDPEYAALAERLETTSAEGATPAPDDDLPDGFEYVEETTP